MDKVKVENYTEFMKGAMEDDWVQIDTPYFSFNVRSFIPLIEMMYLCDEVVDNCFADEAEKWFHPEVEEFEFRRAVIGAYTNIELPNDLPEGNKCDLDNDLRKVKKSEAEDFANSKKIPFLETSALNRINVKECFAKVAHDFLEATIKKQKPSGFGKACGCEII